MTNDLKLFRWYDYVLWLIIVLVLVIPNYYVQRYSSKVISDSSLESQLDVSSLMMESVANNSRMIYRTKDGLIQLNDNNVVAQIANSKILADLLKNQSNVYTGYLTNSIRLSPNKNFALYINKTIGNDYQYDPNAPQELKILDFSSGKEITIAKTKSQLLIRDFNWNIDGESICLVTSLPYYTKDQKVQVRYPNGKPPIYLNKLDLKNGKITSKAITFPYTWHDSYQIKDLTFYNDTFYFHHDTDSSKYAVMSFKDGLNTINDTIGFTSKPMFLSDSKHNKYVLVGDKSIFSYDFGTQNTSSLDIPNYRISYFNPALSSDGTKLFIRRLETSDQGSKTIEDAVYMYNLQTKENKKIYDLGIDSSDDGLASISFKDDNDSLYISRYNGSLEKIKNILVNITTLKIEDIPGLPENAIVVN